MNETDFKRAQAFRGARSTLLTVMILTIANTALVMFNFDFSFIVTDEAIPLSFLLATRYYSGAMSVIYLVGFVVLPLALMACGYFFSNTNSLMLGSGVMVCAVDVFRLLYFKFTLLSGSSLIIDIVALIAITGYMVYGFISALNYRRDTGRDINELIL